MKKQTITTQAEARQYAIDWQQWQSQEAMSYDELARWQAYLDELAVRLDLYDEFKENGII